MEIFKNTEIINGLKSAYKDPKTELENWRTPFEFIVCVILSAQATDKGVNKITRQLFERYKNIECFANAKQEDLEKAVSSINFYKMKTKRIIDAANFILKEFNGVFPDQINELIKIPGIGRKSANVFINEVLKIKPQGIVVDTHVTRLGYRLGLTKYEDQKDAEKIESELQKFIDEKDWAYFSSAAVLFGRYICKAKKPLCSECTFKDKCPSASKFLKPII